jgi:Zn-dependent protease with chaperone function
MNVTDFTSINPTDIVSVDFKAFAASRQIARAAHMPGGVPDYSFGVDRELRTNLTAIPALRSIAQMIVRSHEPLMQQMHLMDGIAVGPDQFPEIFRMGERCAERLGIGMPRIFILNQGAANAWTYASDDDRPSIVITTLLRRYLNDEELTAVIGHECGHIHNLHSAYNTLVELTSNLAASRMLSAAAGAGAPIGLLLKAVSLLGQGIRLAMLQWSRAAEITCDRAGAICVGGVRPMMTALAKLKTGGEGGLSDVNLEAYVRQLDRVRGTPVKLMELFQSHPMTQKRIAALAAFEDSEIYRTWLPAVEASQSPRSRQEVERCCVELVKVMGRG